MSKALSSTELKINNWLRMPISDLPNSANQSDYTTDLISISPLKSIRELLETIINRPGCSLEIGRALDLLGVYFNLPECWLSGKLASHTHLLDSAAAAFADAWIYRQWLHHEFPQAADQFAYFFAKSVMHPEWMTAVYHMSAVHYSSVGGNLDETIHFVDLMNPDHLKGTPWYPNESQKMGKELMDRAWDAANWLHEIFTSKEQEKAQKLESGLNHISLAAIKGDKKFFIGLGKVLDKTFEPPKNLSLEQIQEQPIAKGPKVITNRQWCRRIWISRGLWLLPKHLLERSPFSLSTTTTNELIGKRYKGKKRLTQNDELYQAKSPWFKEWGNDNASISLTPEGKKQFPQFAEKGLPWSIVSADIEDPE